MVVADGAVGMADVGTVNVGALRKGLARETGAVPAVAYVVGVVNQLTPTGEDVELVVEREGRDIGGAKGATLRVAEDDGIGKIGG